MSIWLGGNRREGLNVFFMGNAVKQNILCDNNGLPPFFRNRIFGNFNKCDDNQIMRHRFRRYCSAICLFAAFSRMLF